MNGDNDHRRLLPNGEDLRNYVKSIARHWLVLILITVFGVIGTVQNIGQSVSKDFQVPPHVWFGIALLGIFIAQFLAWLDMKRERDTLRQYDVQENDLVIIAEHRQWLIGHQNNPIDNGIALGRWISEYEARRRQIVQDISEKISQAEASLFEHIGIFPLLSLPQDAYDHIHLQKRSMVIRDHRHLTSLIMDVSRNKPRSMITRLLGDDSVEKE